MYTYMWYLSCNPSSLLPTLKPVKVRGREQEECFLLAIMSAQRDPMDLNKQ
jgi:hypothetical protein